MTVFAITTSIVLLLLVVAVVGLFATMGELAARVGAGSAVEEDATTVPVDEARLGVSPSTWPDELSHLQAVDTAVVLVLSPLCSSCVQIAPTVAGHPALARPDVEFALVVSCASRDSGVELVRQSGLVGVLPIAYDVNGVWLTNEFAVDLSPAALVLNGGRLGSAVAIASMASVAAITESLGTEHTDPSNGKDELYVNDSRSGARIQAKSPRG